ncbi:hypothetical protein F2P81_020832 [Scophthalmus maximus]|uniref:Fibronectin type-III domain-containing protein n=1 Tax=Scophthalmus maximus TaxID=52904 RepID=A0A6A4S1F7_SCOMX|nr:hypothetical protein F2P81_020832 [Scophthalmus maximus]
MLQRFLEQQPAIHAALLSAEVRKTEKEICTLSESDITAAEEVVTAMKPMKVATLVMSQETTPTLSVVAPLHAQLIHDLQDSPTDSNLTREIKSAVCQDLKKRYLDEQETLCVASPMDPRLKALPFLSEDQRQDICAIIIAEAARSKGAFQTSIHHEDGVLVIAPCSMSLSSLFNVEPILPSSGEKRSNQSADESEGESVTTDGCRGEYELRVGTNLLSSPSSSSLSAFFSEPQPNFSSNQTSDFSPQSEVSLSKETHSSAGLNHTMSTDTDSLTVGIIETDKVEKEVVGHMDNQDVNLLTLTFGRHREEREELESNIDLAELEPESQSASEEYNITPTQLSWYTKKVAIEKVSCSGDEEEEEEHSGYMGHPKSDRYWILPMTILQRKKTPSNVSISSFNMEHTVNFLPGPRTPSDTHFTVQIVQQRKSSWKPVVGCLELTPGQMCNLTRVFKNPYTQYKARVQAFTPSLTSNWTVTGWFLPLSSTVLGPPNVSVSGCGNCLILLLKAPATKSLQLENLYRGVILNVQRTRDGAQFRLNLPYSEEKVIMYLQPGTEYCVTVSVTAFFNNNSVSSKPYCAFTSHPPPRSSLYVVFGLLGAFCMLGFLITRFVVHGCQL